MVQHCLSISHLQSQKGQGELITPCHCKDPIVKFCHQECLASLIRDGKPTRCDFCGFKYIYKAKVCEFSAIQECAKWQQAGLVNPSLRTSLRSCPFLNLSDAAVDKVEAPCGLATAACG